MAKELQCAECGIKDSWMRDFQEEPGGRIVCRHRYACEARQMLARGESVEAAAAHAQQPRPW